MADLVVQDSQIFRRQRQENQKEVQPYLGYRVSPDKPEQLNENPTRPDLKLKQNREVKTGEDVGQRQSVRRSVA